MQSKVRTVISIFSAALLIFACNQNLPSENEVKDSGTEESLGSPEFISVMPGSDGYKAIGGARYVSTVVTPEDGGFLRKRLNGDNLDNPRFAGMTGKVTLEVLPNSVDQEVTIGMDILRGFFLGDINMEYSPHGLIFKRPALLNIIARNIDLSNVDPKRIDRVGIYYENQETGRWERMRVDNLVIRPKDGYIKVENARLPHFSRYAVAYGR